MGVYPSYETATYETALKVTCAAASKETYRVTYVSKVLCLDCYHNWNHTHLIHAYFVKAFPIERTDLKRHLNKQSPI